MGDWTITIHGTGCHHNHDYSGDADRMAVEFVKALRIAGHNIAHVSITAGSREDLLTATALTPHRVATAK